MIDHVILTVRDLNQSVDFYNKAMKPLGISMTVDFKGKDGHADLKGFGDSRVTNGDGVHVGFVAKDHGTVKAFHTAAVEAGATSLYAPRVFPEYYPGYFATWIIDPDGYEIELANKS